MTLKAYAFEIVILIAVAFMCAYPPHVGAILFGLALTALVAFKVIDHVHTRGDDALKERVEKLASDVERIVLRRG